MNEIVLSLIIPENRQIYWLLFNSRR